MEGIEEWLLSEGNAVPVAYENVIAFGSLKLSLVSSPKFYELLRSLGKSSGTE